MILLAEAGINVLINDKDGNTALHIAVIRKNKAAFNVLIQSDFPTDLRNNDNLTAL